MRNDDIGSLNESPLEVVVGLFTHVLIAGLTAAGVELVGFIDVVHDHLGLSSMNQERNASGFLDLVDDPVTVAAGFKGHGSSFWENGKEIPDGAGLVIDPGLLNG